MWGFTIYLMRLVDYIQGQKDKRTCIKCNFIAKSERELGNHMKKEHVI